MLSVTSGSASRPKSPVLEQPDRATSAKTANRAAKTAGGGLNSLRHRARGDIGRARSASPGPSTAAVFRRWMGLGLGRLGMRIRVTLDPDHGQDDDRCGFIRPVTTAEAHNAPPVREFNYVAHQPPTLPTAIGRSVTMHATRHRHD